MAGKLVKFNRPKRTRVTNAPPQVAIDKDGKIRFNSAAYEKYDLEKYDGINLYNDEDNNIYVELLEVPEIEVEVDGEKKCKKDLPESAFLLSHANRNAISLVRVMLEQLSIMNDYSTVHPVSLDEDTGYLVFDPKNGKKIERKPRKSNDEENDEDERFDEDFEESQKEES